MVTATPRDVGGGLCQKSGPQPIGCPSQQDQPYLVSSRTGAFGGGIGGHSEQICNMAKNFTVRKTRDEETAPDQEIWLAIRNLDPDRNSPASKIAFVVTLLALIALVCVVWVLLHLRGLQGLDHSTTHQLIRQMT